MKSFEADGNQIDTGSGYKAPKSETRYTLVTIDGNPVDLVRSAPTRGDISVIATKMEKLHKRKKRQVPTRYSALVPIEGVDYISLTEEEFKDILADRELMAELMSAANPRAHKRHTQATKEAAIQARLAGRKWFEITRDHGVAKSTAQHWVKRYQQEGSEVAS